MKQGSYLEDVRNQYENYPYPSRDPEDERKRLVESRFDALDSINHHCFGGTRDLSSRFRVLVPGGGTGDSTIFLAEQLRDTNTEVVYLDMSAASMQVARDRARVRGLDNITWVHDSLLNLPELGLGQFDYITCTGVLHHLADPDAGLAALRSVLAADGAMMLMVYGTYGRIPIYQLQEVLRRINAGTEDIQRKVDNARKVLQSLPASNWFNFNKGMYAFDLKTDIGIYDLLLHTQDRAYTVPQFYDYVEAQGLVLNSLLQCDHKAGQMVFDPSLYLRDPELLASIQALPTREQQAICELLFGLLWKQMAYVGHGAREAASVDSETLIPSFSICLTRPHQLKPLQDAFGGSDPVLRLNELVAFSRTPISAAIFGAIDARTSIRGIIDKVAAQYPELPRPAVANHARQLLNVLCRSNCICLRAPEIAPYPTLPELEARIQG
jgi:2-polyprenyl-3-methyl-5-hydroxy-6-metoxy-1,4-benzoquinol methylase